MVIRIEKLVVASRANNSDTLYHSERLLLALLYLLRESGSCFRKFDSDLAILGELPSVHQLFFSHSTT